MIAPSVSIVIPAYNEVKYVPACIASLAAQTQTDFEVIVVTRGEDKTTQLCQAANWKVIPQKGKGGFLCPHGGLRRSQIRNHCFNRC